MVKAARPPGESERTFRSFFNNAQVGFVRTTIDKGIILEANDRLAEMFGYGSREELMAEFRLSEHYVEQGMREAMLEQCMPTREISNFEAELSRKDGSGLWLRYTGRIYPEKGYLEAVLVDITEEKAAVEALRESEETARTLLNATTDKAVLLDRGKAILDINEKWAQRLGIPPASMRGRSAEVLKFFQADTAAEVMFEAVLSSKKPARFVNTQEGRVFDNRFYPIFDRDGEVKLIAIFCRDITEQKRAEMDLHRSHEILFKEHLKRKQLSRDLINLLEQDRHNFAMELHDQIGQALTTLKMDLEMILEKVGPVDDGVKRQLVSARDKAVQTIRDIKDIAAGLRPSVLDDLGLVAAVSELCDSIKHRTRIEMHLFTRNVPQRIDVEKELAVYRIIQEGLNNVMKHSGAREAFVNVVKKEDSLLVSVEDDGMGFDLDEVMRTARGGKGSLGLLIMEERAVQLAGKFSIEPRVGEGTHLWAEIPL